MGGGAKSRGWINLLAEFKDRSFQEHGRSAEAITILIRDLPTCGSPVLRCKSGTRT